MKWNFQQVPSPPSPMKRKKMTNGAYIMYRSQKFNNFIHMSALPNYYGSHWCTRRATSRLLAKYMYSIIINSMKETLEFSSMLIAVIWKRPSPCLPPSIIPTLVAEVHSLTAYINTRSIKDQNSRKWKLHIFLIWTCHFSSKII